MEEEKRRVIGGIFFPAFFVAMLWGIKLTEYYFSIEFARLGILPRTIEGFPGIFTAPLIHGDLNHLYSNTLPLLILGMIIFYFYRKVAFQLFFWIYFASGLFVWIAGSGEGYHIGASGLVYGFVSFLFFSGLFRKNRKSMALALLVTFVYGSMVWGIFPLNNAISWETHFFGALVGCFFAWYYRKTGRLVAEEDMTIDDDEEQDGDFLPWKDSKDGQNSQALHYFFDPQSGKFYPMSDVDENGNRRNDNPQRKNPGNSGSDQQFGQ